MKRIVIVGAGIAGLQAATYLYRRKVPFLLLEQSMHAGGRVRSDVVDGFILDHGFQVLQTNYPSVQHSFDLKALDLQAFDSGAKLWWQGQWASFLNPLRAGLRFLKFVPEVISLKDLILLGRLWINLHWYRDLASNSVETTAALLKRWEFSESFQSKFFKPFFRGIYLDQNLKQPASLFFFFMQQFLEGQAALPAAGMGAIVDQLLMDLPKESIRFGAKVTQLGKKYVQLSNGEEIEFDRLIMALDPLSAAQLLQVDLGDSVHLGAKTFYFSVPIHKVKDKLLHLIPGESKLLHYCFLSHVAPSYAPDDRGLLQATSLDVTLDEKVMLGLLEAFEDVTDFQFLRAYAIPRGLLKVGSFELLNHVAQSHGIYLAGDYCEMPALHGALVSGENAAANCLN